MKLSGFLNSKNRFKRNFARVATANIAAQLLLFICTPILSRIYSPSSFGIVAFFLAAVQICNAFYTLKIDWLLPNAADDKQAEKYFHAGIVIIGCAALFTILAIFFREYWLGWWPGMSSLGDLIWLVPIAASGAGLHSLFQAWFVRKNDLTIPSKVKITQAFSNIAVSLAVGVVTVGPHGLVLGMLFGTFAGLVTMVKSTGSLLAQFVRCKRSTFIMTIQQIHRQAIIATSVSLLNTLSTVSPVIALSTIYNDALIGVFSLMLRFIATPLGIISTALSQSFWSRAAELARMSHYGALNKLYWKVTRYLACASLVIVVVCLSGPYYVQKVFGPDWQGAGTVLSSLTPMLLGTLIFSATNHLIVLGKQGLQIFADLTRIILICFSVLLGNRLHLEFSETTLLVAISSLIGHMILFAIHLAVHRKLVLNRLVEGNKL